MPRAKLKQHPTAKLGSRNARRSIRGAGWRNDRRMTLLPNSTQIAASSNASGLAQPRWGASLRTSCKLPRKIASSGKAKRSTERKLRQYGRSISTAHATSSATSAPGGRLIRNSQCHEKRSVIKPPTAGPRVGASIANRPATRVARLRPSPSNIKKIAEKTSGIRAPPQKPCNTRAGISDQKLFDAAQAKLATVKPQTQARKAPRVDRTRVSQPVSGIATISAIRYAVCTQLN